MKIFNRGNGWYIVCKNYKDDQDHCTIGARFRKGSEPAYNPPAGNDFTFLDINIKDMSFNSYQNQCRSITIWDYEIKESKKERNIEQENKEFNTEMEDTEYGVTFGSSDVEIEPEELPFY